MGDIKKIEICKRFLMGMVEWFQLTLSKVSLLCFYDMHCIWLLMIILMRGVNNNDKQRPLHSKICHIYLKYQCYESHQCLLRTSWKWTMTIKTRIRETLLNNDREHNQYSAAYRYIYLSIKWEFPANVNWQDMDIIKSPTALDSAKCHFTNNGTLIHSGYGHFATSLKLPGGLLVIWFAPFRRKITDSCPI